MACGRSTPVFCTWRYGIAYIGFFGMFLMYAMRLNLSLGIVCMVKRSTNRESSNLTLTNQTTPSYLNLNVTPTDGIVEDQCLASIRSDSDIEGTFEWPRSLQGTMLSAYFYGYIVTQIPGGWLAKRFGAKMILFLGLTVSAAGTFLTPLAARTSMYFVIAIRVVVGIGSGVMFPCCHQLWAHWAPVFERTKLVSLSYSGTIFGNIVTYFLSGYLCVYGFDGGWPSIFYISGIAEVVWLAIWLGLVYNSPSEHPCISEDEKDYIIDNIGDSVAKTSQRVPWLKFATSMPLIAIIVAHVCNNYVQYTLMTCLPTYMKDVLKFDMKQNGLFSSLPYVTMLICAIIFGQLADCLRDRGIRTVIVRKVYQFLAFVLPAIFLIAASFVDCERRMVAVGLLITAVACSSLNRSGYVVNHLDIAPRYGGILFGITNTFATIPGMTAPIAVGQLTSNGTREEWQVVFYICAGVAIFGAIFYSIFADGKEQSWARDQRSEQEISMMEK
ncbi:sialin-like isoform X2 [Lineus longissimus]|uniref:sialin-like isoform X2 n=1 Tax=Lineus longissimus TaxID=88925 RepID=UPI002B4EF71C